jgi:hypothetical protein
VILDPSRDLRRKTGRHPKTKVTAGLASYMLEIPYFNGAA